MVTIVGAATLLFGAIIGCAKDDIKKALAGSTMSQIGYMMLAAGLGPAGYGFAIAHLLAHGFFKAGLFLGAGSVMHGMNDEVDMRRFGGLRTVMPITVRHVRARLPGDHRRPAVLRLLHQGRDHRRRLRQGRHLRAILGAGRADRRGHHRVLHDPGDVHDLHRRAPLGATDAHPHESPPVMTVPMIVLAIGSVGAGAFLIVERPARSTSWPRWSATPPPRTESVTPAGLVTLALMLVGIVDRLGDVRAARGAGDRARTAGPLTVAARKDLYGDALNESLLMRPGQWLTRLSVYFDNRGVDGLVNTRRRHRRRHVGPGPRRLQTGFVRSYALSMFFGAVLLVGALLLVRL